MILQILHKCTFPFTWKRIHGLLKPGIKIPEVCLEFETNISEHKTMSNSLETIDKSFKLAFKPRILQ